MHKSEYKKIYLLEDKYWWYRALHELIEYQVNKFRCTNKKDLDILDAGCGTGKLLAILNKYGRIKGIDYSKEAIDYCKVRGLKNVEVADLCNYNFGEFLYDVITCIDVLYHSAIEDDIKILSKLYYSLKDNSLLILNLPAFDCLKRKHDTGAAGGERRYRRNVIIPQLIKIGFKIELQSYRLPLLFFPVLMKKYFEKSDKGNQVKSDLKELPFFVNWLLLYLNRLENRIIGKANIPFGTSLFIVARK